jgi:hypothetical protein
VYTIFVLGKGHKLGYKKFEYYISSVICPRNGSEFLMCVPFPVQG